MYLLYGQLTIARPSCSTTHLHKSFFLLIPADWGRFLLLRRFRQPSLQHILSWFSLDADVRLLLDLNRHSVVTRFGLDPLHFLRPGSVCIVVGWFCLHATLRPDPESFVFGWLRLHMWLFDQGRFGFCAIRYRVIVLGTQTDLQENVVSSHVPDTQQYA